MAKLSADQALFRSILGLTSILPFLLVAMLFLPSPSWMPRMQWTLWHLGVALALILPILGYFLVRLWRLETIDTRSKTFWTLRIFLTGGFTLPLFWFFFVWKAETYAAYEVEDFEKELNLMGTEEEEEEDEED